MTSSNLDCAPDWLKEVIFVSLCNRNSGIILEPLQIWTHNCVDQYRKEKGENIEEKKSKEQEKEPRRDGKERRREKGEHVGRGEEWREGDEEDSSTWRPNDFREDFKWSNYIFDIISKFRIVTTFVIVNTHKKYYVKNFLIHSSLISTQNCTSLQQEKQKWSITTKDFGQYRGGSVASTQNFARLICYYKCRKLKSKKTGWATVAVR
jgi:hypothetical protein